MAGEQKRLEADLLAKEEARRRQQADMDALRNKALMQIREAEARANSGRPQLDPSKLDVYKEGSDNKKVSGTLVRVNCSPGGRAELVIAKGKQATTLLVPDPARIAIGGGGERTFSCGVQKPARSVTAEYSPRSDLGSAIAGEAVQLEFK